MKTQSSLIQLFAAGQVANAALKISVLVSFLLLFATQMNAQVTVSPYPDVDNGQQLYITPDETCYDDIMQQSEVTRSFAQADVDASYPENPVTTDYWSCHGNVCCHTYYVIINCCPVYITNCMVNGEPIDAIVQ